MKYNQIIRSTLPRDIVIDFIKTHFHYEKESYISNKSVFKKIYNDGSLHTFFNILKLYYYESKQFYINRNINYKHYNTILRQVTNALDIPSKKKITYHHNTYEIIYYFSLE